MKKKVFSLMMVLLLAASGFVRADELTVHDGTATNGNVPVYGFYADAYNRCEMIYPAAELSTMNGGTISSLKFYATQANVNWGAANFQIYVSEVADATFSGTTFVAAGTNVYEGALSIVGNQMVVTFTTPYTYNGGNLLIGIAQTVTGSYITSTWNGEAVNGASISNYNYNGLNQIVSATQRNFLPKTTFTYTAGGGETPGGGGSSDPEIGLHVVYDNGEEARELVIDDLYLGEYPAGAWMEPFHFEMYNDDTQALTVSVLDFTPNTDALSMATGTELPFTVAGNSAEYIDLAIQVQAPANAEAGDYEYQFVAIYEGSRLAKIWPLSFTIYTPEIPDVVEKAHDLGTIADGYTYTGVPSEITPTVLHNDYTLPFPEIPEGNDAVYKFTVEGDMIISAYVDETNADGKVALYTEDFNGEAGPMATNNYTGLTRANDGREGTITQGFEEGMGEWTMNNCESSTGIYTSTTESNTGGSCFRFKYTYNPPQYLISPELADNNGGTLSFYCKRGGTYYTEYYKVGYSTTTNDPSAFTFGSEVTVDFNTYMEQTATFPAGTKYIAIASTGYDEYYLFVDDITIELETAGGGGGGGTSPLANVSAGPVIEDLPLQAGTYYLVASSTDADYTVYINVDDMPCPAIDAPGFALNPYPADDQDSIQPASVTLSWTNPEYATGWRLVFGSTYYPEAGHPQTVIYPEDGSFSTEMANSYTVTNLWNNTNYFWHVEFNNTACADGVSSPIWGFTTTFNAPQNLVATPEQIFEGETTTLTWNAIVDRTYRTYRVYKDGVMIHETQPTPNPNVEANLTWTVPASELTYNMTGYTFNVTAVYDEGESPFSNDAVVMVSGYSADPGIYGYVYEQDSVTPIGGVTVTVTGLDEFGNAVNYSATTDNNGYYTMHPVLAGKYNTALAYCAGYQDAEPYTNVPPFTLPYQGTWGEMNFIMQEEFYPSPLVCAETVQVGDDELVKVWWQIPDGTGGTGTGDFLSEYEAQVGNGTQTTTYVPFHTLWDNSLSVSIYTAEELAAAGATPAPMTSVSWYSTTGCSMQQGLTMWIGNVTDNQVPANSPSVAGMTKVYTGSMAAVSGWNEFAFNAGEFAWDGTSNIMIVMQRNNGDWDGSTYWQCHPAAGKVAYKYQDNTPFDVENATVSMTPGTDRPNIIFKGGTRANGGERAMHHYRIYRTDCYYDGPYYEGDPGGTIVLASAWVPDTAYFDVSWPDAAPGVYKWGVGVVYEGNQADNPNNPRNRDEFTYGFENDLEGWTVLINNLGMWDAGYWMHSDDNLGYYDYTGAAHSGTGFALSASYNDWTYDPLEADCYLVSPQSFALTNGASLNFFYDYGNDAYPDYFEVCVATTAGAPSIADFTPIWNVNGSKNNETRSGKRHEEDRYENWREVTIDLSAYAGQNVWISFHHEDYDNFEVFIDDVTINTSNGSVGPTPTPTPGVNNCDNLLALPRESCTVWSNECSPCIDKDMEIEVSVNVLLNSADSPEGTTVGFTNLNAIEQAMHPQDMLTLDDSGYHLFDSFRRGTYAIEVRHEGYYTIHDTVNIGFDPNDTRELRYVMTEILYPVRDLYISRTGWAMWERESGWEDGEPTRHFNYYKVMCTSIDGEPIFNKNTEHPFCQVETNELVEGNYYICKVACMFTTGMSAWTEQVFQYEPCDHWGPVDFVNADVNGQGNHLVWQFDHGHNQWIDPNDPDDPNPNPGEGDSFTVNFDEGMPAGWISIDADGDGNGWLSSMNPGIYHNAGVDLTGSGHDGSAAFVISGSFANQTGQPLFPDNYLVTPQVALGGTFSFWACAQDASYAAEHFGVAVSTTGTNATDFTTIQEWTLTAKGGNGIMSVGREGANRAQGNWYQFSVDLSSYSGQGYIAIRHFNCTDQFILNVDDVELAAPAKGGVVNNYKDQPVYRQYADNGIILNFFGIDNVDFRSFLLYNITKNDNFVIVPENEHGQFIVSPREEKGDFAAQFAEFYNSTEADFNLLSKSDILENANLWKSGVNPTYYLSIMMDVFANNSRVENDRCINSMPFCTTDLIEFETASTDQTAEQLEGQDFDDGCIGMSYNPSWYHLRIQTAGPFIIHMEGHDPNDPSTTRDVDFCIWGPFTDPTEPCVDQLTTDKIIDCSYSASYEEDIYLGYPGNQHDHGFGDHGDITYHVPQVGEYYIMMLTNYSRQPCVMSFTKTEGEGETDCDIVVPTNIIGFLITQDGEYLDFVGPEVREYTHVGEFGGHEYCVRPIYPGPAILPDTNYYWCMGCPVCVNTNGGGGGGEEICEPVSNLTGYYLNYNGQEGLVLDWEEPEGATTVRIYADDEYVGDAPASTHPIFLGFDGEVPEHTFVLGVVAVHADCESEMVTVSIYYDDIEENSVACALFPNPTNGNVKIMAKDMRHITVTSVLGQVVYDADVKGDEMDFNMGQFNAGVYMVRIVTEAGIHTQRVTVVR